MSSANGYGSVVTSGSVFMFDTGDTYNSYIGEPTTNICTGVDYSIYNSGATNYRNQTSPLPPAPGYEVVKVVANTPGTYGQSILWRAPYSTNVMTATNSVYAWLESGTYVQVGQHWYPWNYGSPKYIPTGKWVRISETYTINEGNSYGSAAMVYSTDGVAYFSMPQYEIKPHMTPFIGFDQTRSVSQGLLPIVDNLTMDLTNVSFDSNAQITFDGTDDRILTSENLTVNGSQTLAAITIISGGPQSPAGIISNHDYANTSNFGLNHINGNRIGISIGYTDNTREYDSKYSAYTATVGVPFYVVMTFDQPSNTVKLYINGALDSTFALSKTVKFTSRPIVLGRWDYQYNYYYFNGTVPVGHYFNRALTAAEVQQNYNKYKTRFNLS